jgi:biotin operon repressor
MKTQEQIILDHLVKHNTITSIEAIRKYNITRISAVIYNLRRQGYHIDSSVRDGATKMAIYTLDKMKTAEASVAETVKLGVDKIQKALAEKATGTAVYMLYTLAHTLQQAGVSYE